MRGLPKRLGDASITTKYLISVLLLCLTLLVCGVYVCVQGYRISAADHVSDARGGFSESCDALASFEKRMMHLVTLFQQNQQANDMLQSIPVFGSGEHVRNQAMLWKLLYTMRDGSGDYSCRLYVDPKLGFAGDSSMVLSLDDIADAEWARQALNGWGWRRFYSADTLGADMPALIAPIRDLSNYGHLIAILRIDIGYSALGRLIAPSADYISCYIETIDGGLVYSTREDEPRVPIDVYDKDTVTGFAAAELNSVEWEGRTVFYRTLPASSWRMVSTVNHAAMRRETFPQFLTLSVIGGLVALCGILFAFPVIGSTVMRIRRFYRYVEGAGQTGITERLDPMGDDEVGRLIVAHNALLDRIEALVREREEKEREMRRLEMSALQAQIKPHFLYNTLEAISWMARRDEPDKVEGTVRSLTRFYRLCLSRGADVLTVEKEIEIVRNYFNVQSMRYGGVFTLDVDVSADVLPLLLPRITLQPLVENALMHGILESGRPEGAVRVFSRRGTDGCTELCVADTGAHFTEEDWQNALRCAPDGDAVEGYGLSNVEKRLCLLMNVESVLYLDNSCEGMTCIVLRFAGAER